MIKNLKLQHIYSDPESDNPRVDYKALPDIKAKISEQGFDPSFPLQVVKCKGPNGETHKVTGGFTRYKAAAELDLEEVPCIVTSYTPEEILRNHLTSNSGNPLTQSEQGKVFIGLRDYGTDPEKLTKGEEVREKPRSLAELAKYTGYSAEHVRNCITIAESPKEIRELLETGKVSANAVIDASKGVKEPKTIRKILDAAVEAAGSAQATNKHVKEVKAQFVESKPLKGKTSKETSAPQTEAKTDSAPKTEATSGSSMIAETETTGEETVETQPESQQPTLIESNSPKKDSIIAILTKACDDFDIDLDDSEIEKIADRLHDVF